MGLAFLALGSKFRFPKRQIFYGFGWGGWFGLGQGFSPICATENHGKSRISAEMGFVENHG